MSTQKWIDRYGAEVGRMLPERNRADVEKEIRSLLQDAADAEESGADPPTSRCSPSCASSARRARWPCATAPANT